MSTTHWARNLHGKPRKAGQMNRTEAKYAAHLEGQKVLGTVLWFSFEAVTLKLAKDCRYLPDFIVMRSDGLLEVHEVKGFWAEAAKVRIKVAAAMFPFRFIAVHAKPKKDGGGWRVEEF